MLSRTRKNSPVCTRFSTHARAPASNAVCTSVAVAESDTVTAGSSGQTPLSVLRDCTAEPMLLASITTRSAKHDLARSIASAMVVASSKIRDLVCRTACCIPSRYKGSAVIRAIQVLALIPTPRWGMDRARSTVDIDRLPSSEARLDHTRPVYVHTPAGHFWRAAEST